MRFRVNNLDYMVLNVRTGNAVALFLLLSDAVKYVKELCNREGNHGAIYEITRLSDGTNV